MSALRAYLERLQGLGLIVLVLGVIGTSGTVQGPPRPVTMQDLTVPKDRLPAGCSLKVIEPARREVMSTSESGRQTIRIVGPNPTMQPLGVTANPWIGTDRRTLAWLRQRVDGYGDLRLPDAPPLTTSEAAAMVLQFANGVEEGYAATYAQSVSRDLAVQAV